MIGELATWLESYSGVSYDFSDDIKSLYVNVAFIDTFEWYNRISNIEQNLNSACDIIDTYGYALPNDLQNPNGIKKMLTSSLLGDLTVCINQVKQVLTITTIIFSSFETLNTHVNALKFLIDLLIEYPTTTKRMLDVFNEYDEENDYVLTESFGISKNDIPNMQFTVSDVRQSYFDSIDEG